MFQNLRTSNQIYILHKDGTPFIETGAVVSVSAPHPKYPVAPQLGQLPQMETVVDLTVNVNGQNTNLQGLPAGADIADFASRETVVVTSLSSSPAQFLNSWTHEMFHLCRHVAQACGIDPYGEEAAYLAGTVAQKMFPVAGKLLCSHCRKGVEEEVINDRKSRLWHTAHTSTS